MITTQSAVSQPTSPAVELSFQPESGLWVTLRNELSDYSYEEALLLCEAFPGEWVAWVPGFGEVTLSRGQFHQIV
jgi:hypothetical protein